MEKTLIQTPSSRITEMYKATGARGGHYEKKGPFFPVEEFPFRGKTISPDRNPRPSYTSRKELVNGIVMNTWTPFPLLLGLLIRQHLLWGNDPF
jgi:hypothetical protein